MQLNGTKKDFMKIAAVVILYHPNDSCLTNIKSYIYNVSKVYIFDNTEKESSVKNELVKLSKVSYFHDNENKGLPARLNEAANYAIEDGYDWLITMDQDSFFLEENFTKYINCFSHFQNKETVAMFGTSNFRSLINSSNQCLWVEGKHLMTSGSLLNLSLFKKIGNFDEALFIDLVDNEYCIRIVLAGYRIVRFSNIYLTHELGNMVYRSSIKTLFLFKKNKEIHTPLRYYYMVRNILYLTKKFEKENLSSVVQLKKDVISRLQKGILYGRYTVDILKHVKMAFSDFKSGKMGRFAE